MQVVIDPRIKVDPKLGPAVEAATLFFLSQAAARRGIVSPTGRLSWGLLVDRPGVVGVESAYSEPNEDGATKRVTRTAFPASALMDPIGREMLMLRLLEDILKWRLDDVNARIADHLRELDTEGKNALAH
jgi:hypothetical protein